MTYGRANGGIPFNLVPKHRPLKRGTTTILINFGARISLFLSWILVKHIGIINYENFKIFLNTFFLARRWVLLSWLVYVYFLFAMDLFFHLFPKIEKNYI